MVFRGMQDFLPAFADFSRASPYDFTHVALTLPLGGAGGEVLGLLQTEHSGINFNPFVGASHTDAERHSPAGQAGEVQTRLHVARFSEFVYYQANDHQGKSHNRA